MAILSRPIRLPLAPLAVLSFAFFTASGCKPKTPPQAPQSQGPAPQETPATVTPAAQPAAEPQVRPTYYFVDSYIHNLDDVFKGIDKFAASWTTSMAVSSRDLARLFLTNLGFKPAFMEQLLLQRTITAHLELPHRDEYLRDYSNFAVALPTQEAAGMVTSFPPNFQIRATGAQLWTGQFDRFQFQMQASADHLAIANLPAGLGRAQADQKTPHPPEQNRIQFTLSQLSDEQRNDLAQSIPESLRNALAPVIRRVSDAAFKMDLGSERAMKASVEAVAPMNELNLPLGPLSQGPSPLAERLPPDAALVAQIMVGNIEAALRTLRAQLSAVPEPFATPAGQAVDALEALGKNVEREMLVAYYVDAKNRGSLLVSADFKDSAAAQTQIDQFWSAVAKAFETHIELVGNSAVDKYKVRYKKKGPRLSGVPSQQFELSIPPRFLKDLEAGGELALIAPLVSGRGKRKSIGAYSAVTGNKAVMVLGAGAKDLARTSLRGLKAKTPSADHLEQNGGLALARRSTQGCQVCGYLELTPLLRALAVHFAAESGKKQELRKLLKKIKKVKLDTGIAGSLKVSPDRGESMMTIPTSFLFAPREQAQLINEIVVDMELLDLPQQIAAAQ